MKRNKFSLSHYRLATMDMGKLYPIACIDVLPGDTFQQSTTALIRMQPMLAPVMHPIEVKIHHWFVPYRLLWDEFEDFITGGSDGNAVPEFPTLMDNFAKGSLGDYFGLSGFQTVSALPFRAYNMIYNHFYRDQDLQTELDLFDTGGSVSNDEKNSFILRPVSWAKDYFTTARPWTQKGSEISVPIDVSGSYRIDNIRLRAIGKGNRDGFDVFMSPNWESADPVVGFSNTFTEQISGGGGAITPVTYNQLGVVGSPESPSSNPNADGRIIVDGTNSTITPNDYSRGISIQDLRLSLALQRYEEARAKYGSRYIEYLRYLGVRSSDARLQLPEYLGGGKQTIQISEVLNTSGDGVLGQMGGHGISAMRSNRYRRFFEEHGVIISLMYIMPKAMYVDGTNRMWLKRTKEDFFQKELQHIGMQEVFTRELKGTAPDDSIFGYQDRYDEYRRHPSGVSGDFRDTLDFWHLGRTFADNPVLNASFITNSPTKRIFAEQTQNEFLIMANHSIQARRMLTKVAKTATF